MFKKIEVIKEYWACVFCGHRISINYLWDEEPKECPKCKNTPFSIKEKLEELREDNSNV